LGEVLLTLDWASRLVQALAGTWLHLLGTATGRRPVLSYISWTSPLPEPDFSVVAHALLTEDFVLIHIKTTHPHSGC